MDREQENSGMPPTDERVWEAVLAARERITAVAQAGPLTCLSDEAVDE